jgi:SAM-dependent methyltransferase
VTCANKQESTGELTALEVLYSCPLCGAPGAQDAPVQPQPPFGLKVCGACSIVYVSPRPVLSAMKAYYNTMYDAAMNQRSPRQERRARRHLSRLARYKPVPGRLLEVGAGDGYFLNAARVAGWEVEGLELSQPRVARARKWFGLTLHCCELAAAPFPPAHFDAVSMLQVLEHLHDPRAALRRAHELLRPGGLLILSSPNILAYGRKKRAVSSWQIPEHLFFFSPRTLVYAVEDASFMIVRRRLKFFAFLEKALRWAPWPTVTPGSLATRNLCSPFGLYLVARKTEERSVPKTES